MQKLLSRFVLSTVLASFAVPAFAHPSGHTHMSWLEVVQHYAEPDHLAFLALTVFAGWVAYRSGRRTELRARVVQKKKDRS